jgi:3-deoxy-D-manno-octulosonic-acid transferase
VNVVLRGAYGAAGALARSLAAVAPPSESKLLATFHARRGIRARYALWGANARDPTRPLLWMHAPSVGEGLQAIPVLRLLRAERPDVQIAYTHFSPSAERFARTVPADFAEYLPFDTGADAEAALRALRPSALVFSKLDVWPVIAAHASRHGVALGLVSATLSSSSSRQSAMARALLRDAYARLDLVGAIDAADAERLVRLGVRADVIRVTGDTRYDQVWEKAARVDRRGALLASLDIPRPTLVAGSTWPSDESHLLPAFARLRARHPDLRIVIAPHEPAPEHLAPIVRWARDAGLLLAHLDDDDSGAADVVLVDRVGVLGELYALADVAYVGGAFHTAGLHSVLEPAAFGAPVIFGPMHREQRDAMALLGRGAALVVADANAIVERVGAWLSDPELRRTAGDRARSVVEQGLGAARRTVELVRRLLPATTS